MYWKVRLPGSMLGWALLVATRLVLADPAHDALRPCEATSAEQAKSLAAVFYDNISNVLKTQIALDSRQI